MKILDLLRMSSSSLWKRKFRTVLTILGVVIGTASIVVMISLGQGRRQQRQRQRGDHIFVLIFFFVFIERAGDAAG